MGRDDAQAADARRIEGVVVTFTDVTAAAGVAGGANEWSTSTGFLDYDRDGDLDLITGTHHTRGLARAQSHD